jgi:hypothetical protein
MITNLMITNLMLIMKIIPTNKTSNETACKLLLITFWHYYSKQTAVKDQFVLIEAGISCN